MQKIKAAISPCVQVGEELMLLAQAASGCDSQSRNRRAPIGVTVRFIAPYRQAVRGAP